MKRLLVVLVLALLLMMNGIEVNADTPATVEVLADGVGITPHANNVGFLILLGIKPFDKDKGIESPDLGQLVVKSYYVFGAEIKEATAIRFIRPGLYTVVIYRDGQICMIKQVSYYPKV